MKKLYILFLRLLRKLKILKLIQIKVRSRIKNNIFYVPIIGEIGFDNLDVSEKWMLDVLDDLSLLDGSTVIDVGVNIGQTLLKIKEVNNNVNYYGFEPNTKCVDYVNTMIECNKWKNVYIIPAGISLLSGVSVLDFYSDSPADSCASFQRGFRGQGVVKSSYCATCSGHDVEKTIGKNNVSLLKIDVEGYELEVVLALANLIKSMRPNILIEILPAYTIDNEIRIERQAKVSDILSSLGYVIYRIHKNRFNGLLSYEEITNFGVHDRLDWCDYLLKPVNL